MGIKFSHKGDFSKSIKFLTNKKSLRNLLKPIFERYGEAGVNALREATPKDTGLTSESWSYKLEFGDGEITLTWMNSNMSDWANVAVLIRYGHATRNGGYVQGNDFITPAMEGIFKQMADDLWKEVTKG